MGTMRRYFLFIAGLFFCQMLTAQVIFPSASDIAGTDSAHIETVPLTIFENVEVNQDPRLEKMLKWHVENNQKRDGINGFRVEIFFSSALSAKEQALKKKKEFLSKYPEYNVHVKFSAPNFRVRVGDFRTKNEALKLYKEIQKDYPGAFIVPDIIDFPLLKTENNYERPD
ncbi:SPOR domain-containing protein [Mariniphaga sediminis]|uniref:SPOR domain-containing protein n=2 Tax=Mariniphaga sediminis TaxID=1628158 RepID=A0A399D4X6_9BACT|nr:SPOR domain-containing protein [Mariniphaga sediminis]